jgi:hypothetical protein
MKIDELLEEYKGDIFDVISNEEIVSIADEWIYYSSINRNAISGVGWLSNDDIFFINPDGGFTYDIVTKELFKDFEEPNIKNNFKEDYLSYYYKKNNENIHFFGLGGGEGNHLTRDNLWKIEIVNVSWNVKIPRIYNYKKRKYYYLEMRQNEYEGYKFIGFSKSQIYFLIMGHSGIDIYKKIVEL